jgi:hypothetical protein
MALSSINSTPQTGSFELLSTQLKNPPALTNNSGSTVTVAITAAGEWSLLNANFVTSDPTLIRYKKPVDGDGLPREKSDEKFPFKYPNLNPAILVGEIKDAKGNTKSTVSGKQQSFELQPGDSVSFIINDDPKWYGDNAGKLALSYSATAKTVEPTKPIEPQTKPEIYTITDLYNTGVDNARQVLGDSVADSHYTLATYPAGTVTVTEGNVARAVTTPNKDLAPINWIANTQTARWIGPNTASAYGPVGDYSYTTTFTLPSFSVASIVGQLSVDDRITEILVNGVSVGNPVPLSTWTTISRFTISKGFVVGTNTIEFKLHSIGGPTGLQIDNISGTYKPPITSANATINELTNKTVFIENLETKRYLFSDGSPITGDRGAEGGWLASSGFASPNVVGADANYYNRAYWKIVPNLEYFMIENLETKRYLFSDGPVIQGNRGDEGGWLISSGFASPNVVGADANYYNRALWKIIPTNGGFLIENLETKRYLFSDGSPIKGDRGAEGGWLASSGFASPNVVGADANYYNRAIWKIYTA